MDKDVKNIVVVGPQHSCTRLFTALFDRHKEIGEVGHWSIPYGENQYAFPSERKILREYDKVVIVERDSNAIDLSNRDKKGMALDFKDDSKNVSQISKAYIKEHLDALDPKIVDERVVFASFETLVTYRDMYLRQLFAELGVDQNDYDYRLKGRYEFSPKRWYNVNLDVIDSNRKYLR